VSASRRDLLRGGAALAALAACGGGSPPRLAGPFRPAVRCSPGRCATVDVHCHVFNASDLPVAAFVSSVAPVPEKLIRRLTELFQEKLDRQAPLAGDELDGLAGAFGRGVIRGRPRLVARTVSGLLGLPALENGKAESYRQQLQRLVILLDYILQPRAEIAAGMIETYPTVDLFTPCLVDFDGWADGRTASSLAGQIRVQERLSKLSVRGLLGRADARMHSFVPFNPLREVRAKIRATDDYRPYGDDRRFVAGSRYDPAAAPLPAPSGAWAERTCSAPEAGGGCELVRHAVETAGFLGVKLYPPVGFLPIDNAVFHPDAALGLDLDRALRAFYAYAEAEQVPITTHGAKSNGYRLGYGDLAAPKGWGKVLREFPALRLNLGHFGHLAGVDAERGILACEAWMRQAGVLMQCYPNVYADMSYSEVAIEADYADDYLDAIEKLFEHFPAARKRIMYGSDWWLNRLSPNDRLHVDAYHQVFEDRFGADVRQDVMGNNALRFLGLVDDRGQSVDSPSRRRLRGFYDAEPLPGWLAG
jgi:predicted TIM-barrel fold metal-dependent hydrolase